MDVFVKLGGKQGLFLMIRITIYMDFRLKPLPSNLVFGCSNRAWGLRKITRHRQSWLRLKGANSFCALCGVPHIIQGDMDDPPLALIDIASTSANVAPCEMPLKR